MLKDTLTLFAFYKACDDLGYSYGNPVSNASEKAWSDFLIKAEQIVKKLKGKISVVEWDKLALLVEEVNGKGSDFEKLHLIPEIKKTFFNKGNPLCYIDIDQLAEKYYYRGWFRKKMKHG